MAIQLQYSSDLPQKKEETDRQLASMLLVVCCSLFVSHIGVMLVSCYLHNDVYVIQSLHHCLFDYETVPWQKRETDRKAETIHDRDQTCCVSKLASFSQNAESNLNLTNTYPCRACSNSSRWEISSKSDGYRTSSPIIMQLQLED